jgi:hypothetical protein
MDPKVVVDYIAGVMKNTADNPVERLVIKTCGQGTGLDVVGADMVHAVTYQVYGLYGGREGKFFDDLRKSFGARSTVPVCVRCFQSILRVAAERLYDLLKPRNQPEVLMLISHASWTYGALDAKSAGLANQLARATACRSRETLAVTFSTNGVNQEFKQAVCAVYLTKYADRIWDIDEGRMDFLDVETRAATENEREIAVLRAKIEVAIQTPIMLEVPATSEHVKYVRGLVSGLQEIDPEANVWLPRHLEGQYAED